MQTVRTLLLLHAVSVVWALEGYTQEAIADQITDLPGLNDAIKFNQFSGYLKISETKNLHYWMVESQGNPSTDPIAFWTK